MRKLLLAATAFAAAGCAGQDGQPGADGRPGRDGAYALGDAGPQAGLRWVDRAGIRVDVLGAAEYAVDPGTGYAWRIRDGYGGAAAAPLPALSGMAGEEAYAEAGCKGARLLRAPAAARWTVAWPGSPHLTAGTYALADDAEVEYWAPPSWETAAGCQDGPAGAAQWAPAAAMLPVATPDAWFTPPLRLE